MSSAPSSAVFFLIYNSFSNPFIAAPIAETCACLIRVPTDVIRINMQNNLHQTISSAFKAGGLYRGLTATLIRDLPFATIQFSIYEYLKSRSSNQVQVLASASVSASIAAILTTPLDVLKTRMSVCTMKIGIIDHLKEIKRQGAFFKGVKPRVLWITMGGVIYLGVYEQVLKLI